jgi:PHD/YefM family antitoxin component YafN of YafNO toxin-antitoxin module
LASEQSMPRTIAAHQASGDMNNLLIRLKSGKEHFVLEEASEEVAVILSISEYRALMQERERLEDQQHRLKQFWEAARSIGQAVKSSGLSEEEIMADLEEAKKEVYQEYYGEK